MMTKKEKQNFYFVCASLIDLMHDLIEEQKQGKDNKKAIIGIGFALDCKSAILASKSPSTSTEARFRFSVFI